VSKPNVILVMCDMLRAHEVGAYGNDVVRTPVLDRLAARGVRFEHAVTNNPVCQPARSSLMSGQYSRTCSVIGNSAGDPPRQERRELLDPTLPELLRDQGYRTALIGKWHIDPDPRLVGFDYAYHCTVIHRYREQLYMENGKQVGRVDFGPDHEAERVDAWLAERAGDEQPFFLYYSPGFPHMPLAPHELERYADAYGRDEIPLRPNVFDADGVMSHDEFWFKIYTIWDYFYRHWNGCIDAAPDLGYPTDLVERPTDRVPEGFDLRELTRLYYGATTCLDDQLGRLVDSLEAQDMLDDTILVFLSDHGDNLGSHNLYNKGTLNEESIRVPMMWHCPDQLAPRVNDQQVAQIVDVAPTILGLLGLEPPAHMHGRDLSGLLRGEQEALADTAGYIECTSGAIGIRTPTHAYGVNIAKDLAPWGLYDLTTDPYQQQDLIAAPATAELRADLHARLMAWDARTPVRPPRTG